MADLYKFITDITSDGVAYCAVCFRTETERKLVRPVALVEFLKITNLGKLSVKESACIFCERQAQVALKLYRTLCFARDVNCMLWSLVDKKMTARGIAYLLPSKVRGQNGQSQGTRNMGPRSPFPHLSPALVPPSEVAQCVFGENGGEVRGRGTGTHTARDLRSVCSNSGPSSVKRNKLLSSLRKYQTFTQTDVLVVDARSSEIPISHLSVIDDDSILIEDDEGSDSSAPRLVPIEKLLEKPAQNPPQKVSDMQPRSIVLYPVKTTENSESQFLIIPEGANIKLDGNTVNVVNNGPTIPVLLPNGNILNMTSPSNQIMLPINDNVLQNHSITIKNNAVCINEISTVEEIILPDKGKIGEKITKILPNKSGKIPLNNGNMTSNGNMLLSVNNVLSQNQISTQNVVDQRSQQPGNQMCQIKNLRSEETCQISDFKKDQMSVISENMCQITNLRSLKDKETSVKPPEAQKKSDPNIDWEDKIPMDVISFMDARDPNAPSIPESTTSNTIAEHSPTKTNTPHIQIPLTPPSQTPLNISPPIQTMSRLEATLTHGKWGGFERSTNAPPVPCPIQTYRKKPDVSRLETTFTKSKWGGIPRGQPPQKDSEHTILNHQLDLLVPYKRRRRPRKDVDVGRKRKSDDDVINIT